MIVYLFLFIPFIFFTLGVTNTFNIFKIEEELGLEDKYTLANSKGTEYSALIDTRTFLYAEEISSAINNNYVILGRSIARGYDSAAFGKGADKIMEFISYSSAILSITLSIFAIQYTYTSNVQIQQQFEKINSAADNIHRTAGNLNLTSSKLDNNLETILERLSNMNTLQREIYTKLNNLNDNKVNDMIIQHNNYPSNSI